MGGDRGDKNCIGACVMSFIRAFTILQYLKSLQLTLGLFEDGEFHTI